jgi:hypothetical protein
LTLYDNQQIPLLLGSKPTRKLDRLVAKDTVLIYSAFDKVIPNQFDETIQLLAAGDCGAISRIPRT